MENRKYADSLDVSKWSLETLLSIKHNINHLIYAAMYHPSKNESKLGCSKVYRPDICDDRVWRFFEDEREAFNANPNARDLRRILRLPIDCGLRFRIHPIWTTFKHIGYQRVSSDYFEEVTGIIKSVSEPVLVLLDPCDGIHGLFTRGSGARKVDPCHVTREEISLVFKHLRRRDILVVFQYKPRGTKKGDYGWCESALELLQSAVGKRVRTEAYCDRDVAFLVAYRE